MKFTIITREVFLMMSLKQESKSEVAYNIVKSLIECEENITRIVYGIQIYANGESCQIENISSDKKKVEQLLHKLRKHEIEPEYLHEYVEDFIAEQYCDFVFAENN